MNRDQLREAAVAAEQAATVFTARGETDEAAVSRLMATRYRDQLNNKEK